MIKIFNNLLISINELIKNDQEFVEKYKDRLLKINTSNLHIDGCPYISKNVIPSAKANFEKYSVKENADTNSLLSVYLKKYAKTLSNQSHDKNKIFAKNYIRWPICIKLSANLFNFPQLNKYKEPVSDADMAKISDDIFNHIAKNLFLSDIKIKLTGKDIDMRVIVPAMINFDTNKIINTWKKELNDSEIIFNDKRDQAIEKEKKLSKIVQSTSNFNDYLNLLHQHILIDIVTDMHFLETRFYQEFLNAIKREQEQFKDICVQALKNSNINEAFYFDIIKYK